MLSEVEYCTAGNLDMALSKALFLLALATGSRVSELHALRREPEFLAFGNNDLTLFSRVSFLAKNEDPMHRRDPIVIPRLWDEDGSPHALCPVHAVHVYMNLTSSSTTGPLFLSSSTAKPLTKYHCSLLLCSIIKDSQPGVFPRTHDIRKMATSLAFFSNMGLKVLCKRVGWASPQVFLKHYLTQIQAVKHSCVVMGSSAPL